jgi:hypothetical protein
MWVFALAAAFIISGVTTAAPQAAITANKAKTDNATAPAPAAKPVETNSCVIRLAQAGIIAEAVSTPVKAPDAACIINEPVVLASVADPALPERRITFPDRPVLSCAMAERFARFTGDITAPLALGIYGKELVSVGTGPGYECRPRNRQSGAKLSSHGQGDAADIAMVTLWGGVKILVEKPADAEALRFISAVRAAACGAFSTVLGPGSDAAHANHLHVDLEARGRDGRSKLCQ